MKGRYELKYPITGEQKARFLEAARHGLSADPHGDDAVYRVSSQYFDSADLCAYWEKLDGVRVRRKFRLRYYGIDDGGGQRRVRSAFMEIKHRIGNTVFKERVALTDAGAAAILADATQLVHLDEHVADRERDRRATIDAVVRAAQRPGFGAACVVTYLREAWEGEVDRRLRLTFDSFSQALSPARFLEVGRADGLPLLPAGFVIMEIKFDDAVPCWIRDIAVRHGVPQQRFSKYAAGMEALGRPISRRSQNAG